MTDYRSDSRANERRLVTLDDVKQDPYIVAFMKRADEQMGLLGYTEHGSRHAGLVGNIGQNILLRLKYPERTAQLAAISGYLHDIGNVVRREEHAHTGGMIAMELLRKLHMGPEAIAIVMGAIGNHEEERGDPVGEVCAAV
ncbi:MAG: phosphohydrolase, partial [Chloroflexi bacterium]|nr:phosphohydrolase [Chloroflexota bacterium]